MNLVSSAFRVAPMPSQVTQGEGVSAALTGRVFSNLIFNLVSIHISDVCST